MSQQLITDFFGKKRSAASPVAIPEAPKKKRKSKKNTILLSKTATAVLKASSLTRAACNLVGQFCGTDIRFYKVGSCFVASTERIGQRGSGVLTADHIRLVNPGVGRGTHRWITGRTFRMYEVERRTACRLRVRQLCTITAYSTWSQESLKPPFDVNNVAGVFRWKAQYTMSQTITPFTDAGAELNVLKDMYEVCDADCKEVKFKANTDDTSYQGELVLVDRE
jgi:hypothetical protein